MTRSMVTRSMVTRWGVRGRLALPAVALVAAVLATVGCAGGGGEAAADEEVTSPLAGCDGLTAPPRDAPATPGALVDPPADLAPALDLPAESSLPCFTGGEPVALAELRGPAVVNVWASWCPPCREELPVLQRFADRSEDELHLVGVVSGDTQRRAAALARDLDLDFPALHDPDERVTAALGAVGLPVTLFLGTQGELRHVHQGPVADEAELAELVTAHLGVDIGVAGGGGA